MITIYKKSRFLSLATTAFFGIAACISTLAADTAAPPKPSKNLQLAKSTGASASHDYLQTRGSFSTLAATTTTRPTAIVRRDDNLARHITAFRGPIGPTLPAGATLHRNPAAISTLLEVTAAPGDLIFDLPPGAAVRKTVVAQTQ